MTKNKKEVLEELAEKYVDKEKIRKTNRRGTEHEYSIDEGIIYKGNVGFIIEVDKYKHPQKLLFIRGNNPVNFKFDIVTSKEDDKIVHNCIPLTAENQMILQRLKNHLEGLQEDLIELVSEYEKSIDLTIEDIDYSLDKTEKARGYIRDAIITLREF